MKKRISVYATFIRKHNSLFRPETYIQFGSSETTLGTVILHNPSNVHQDLFISEGETKVVKVKPNQEMLTIASILKKAYPEGKLDGRVYMYHLFALQTDDYVQAATDVRQNWEYLEEKLLTDLPLPETVLINRLNEGQWVWIAWRSGNQNQSFKHLKINWYNVLHSVSAPEIGIKGLRFGEYYHLCPKVKYMREEYIETILPQLQQIVDPKDPTNLRIIINSQLIREFKGLKFNIDRDIVILNGIRLYVDSIDLIDDSLVLSNSKLEIPIASIENDDRTVNFVVEKILSQGVTRCIISCSSLAKDERKTRHIVRSF